MYLVFFTPYLCQLLTEDGMKKMVWLKKKRDLYLYMKGVLLTTDPESDVSSSS